MHLAPTLCMMPSPRSSRRGCSFSLLEAERERVPALLVPCCSVTRGDVLVTTAAVPLHETCLPCGSGCT